jgi:hypothetical protein
MITKVILEKTKKNEELWRGVVQLEAKAYFKIARLPHVKY